jgi:hypothetical protein
MPKPTTGEDNSRRAVGLAPRARLAAAGQDIAKYSTTNPLVRLLLERLLRSVRASLVHTTGVVVDVGVGEGLALERVRPAGASLVIGVDYRIDKLRAAAPRLPGVSFVRADVGMLPFRDGSIDTLISTEVLEHLVEVDHAVAEFSRVCRGRCIVSVPWEPFFLLGNLFRGKNLSRLGNDPEHIQHFDRRGLRRSLERSFGVVRLKTSFPWIVAEAQSARSEARHA